MSWIRIAVRLLVVVSLVGTALAWRAAAGASAAKSSAGKGAASAAKAKRGEYLVTILGCNDCHTPGTFYGSPDFTRRLSGSELGWRGPWGVSYAANLTPDLDTGLGYWSEQQIVDALRTGINADGRTLTAAMPWMNFSIMTDDDAFAIAAYLKSIPAVSHAVPKPVPPGQKVDGPIVEFPPPPAWDAPRTPPAEPVKSEKR